jgi:hypothetical protein
MQTRISASNSGAPGSSGSSTASRAAGRHLCIPPPRRRSISARKPSWSRYQFERGSGRQIAPAMVQLAEERLSGFNKLNCARRRAVFHAMQCLSRYDRTRGARLPQRSFSSEKIGRFIQEGLVECRLARCMDWDSWKPTDWDFRKATPRAFVPSCELLLADTGPVVVSNFADYCSGRHELRDPLHSESRVVYLNRRSGVIIPPHVAKALQRGTGIYCDFAAIPGLLLRLPESERSRILCALLASTGRVQVEQLLPIWKQHEWGRLYCSKPAVINMPKACLVALRNTRGRPLWNVDFSSYELRIACRCFGQRLPDGDAYKSLADATGIPRPRVKTIINPMLHGQTKRQMWYSEARDREAIADRRLVEKEMARVFPKLFAVLGQLRRDSSLLQREGAQIFFRSMGAAMRQCEIRTAGVPKHDGWIFAGDESQAKAVHSIFEGEAERIAGVFLPVKMDCLANSNPLSSSSSSSSSSYAVPPFSQN